MSIRQWPVRETTMPNAFLFGFFFFYLSGIFTIWFYYIGLVFFAWYYFVRFMNWWTAKYTTKSYLERDEFWESKKEWDPKADYASRLQLTDQQEDRKKDVFDRIGVITEVYQDHSGITVTGTFSEEYLRTRGKNYYA